MIPALKQCVHDPRVNESELLTVFHSFFEYATNPLPRRGRRFGDEKQGRYIDVHFDSKGKIAKIVGKLDDSEAKVLANHIGSVLLDSQEEAFSRTVCFSLHDAVQGYYRYKDIFQIVPVPPVAPHAPVIVADHPFVLEFKYLSCPDQTVATYRRTETAAKLARILNTLCNTSISVGSVYVRHFWGMVPEGKQTTSRWIQEGYSCSGVVLPTGAPFSNTQHLEPIKLFPTSEYYNDTFFPGNYALALPDSSERFLDKVSSLGVNDAKAFEVASIWFAQVKNLWPRAQSCALMALVSSIEALLDKQHETCVACGQPKYGVTKKFKEFLKQHVPDVEKRFPEEFKAMYDMRSGIAHGNYVLMGDLSPWNYFGDPLQQWQDRVQRNTHSITATAIRNWVLSR